MVRISISIFLCVYFIVSVCGGCGNFTTSDFSRYNLDGLTSNFSDYTATTTNYLYYWNFCLPVRSTVCTTHPIALAAQVYQGRCQSVGNGPAYITDGVKGPSTGVQIKYINTQNGRCPGGSYPQTVINANCDPAADTVLVGNVEEQTECVYTINMRSRYACPIGKFEEEVRD